ncbi:hypothetical protein OHB01_35320 [Microbispora hainanensis]|jgi:hypothetical protein|uniref:Uncharacterized protein n=1 Tax=Microbispora hainanensis TaxID=568844 RepID=A0ABZ1SXS8_9ACTN|nr:MULTISPECIES: hypothetical protein [Microbispora]NJP26451.1 hypothetical protein [Microbispora sp. CL1-1]TQS12264.1 hypothetical protein FLW53_20130 [Microbispora sp. SCL1-1]
MPLCTAVLAAALLSGPAAVPPDPAPPGTRATTDNTNAASPSTGRPQFATLPAMVPQAGGPSSTIPQAPPWMTPSGTEGERDDSATAPRSPVTIEGTEADGETTTKYVPVIDPKTRDVFIRPVVASGSNAQAPQPFTFGPVQGVQSTRIYPLPQAEQKAAQPKTARKKPVTRPRQHQRPR